jgi:hypothetical protein
VGNQKTDRAGSPFFSLGSSPGAGMIVLTVRDARRLMRTASQTASIPLDDDFDEEYTNALVEEIAPAVQVRIVRLITLVELKRAAARPQDIADLDELRRLHEDLPRA